MILVSAALSALDSAWLYRDHFCSKQITISASKVHTYRHKSTYPTLKVEDESHMVEEGLLG